MHSLPDILGSALRCLLLAGAVSLSVVLGAQSPYAFAQPVPSNRVPPALAPTTQAPPGVAPPEAAREPAKAQFAPRTFLITAAGQVVGLRSISYSGASITARDVANRNHSYPLSEIAAIISPPTLASLNAIPPTQPRDAAAPNAASSRRGTLTLIDGERFPGRLLLDSDRADSIAWESPVLGRMLCPLSRIAEIRFDAFAPPAKSDAAGAPGAAGRAGAGAVAPDPSLDPLIAPPADLLDLANGDRVAGFIRALGADVAIDTGGGAAGAGAAPMSIPTERITRILFSGPREPDSGPLAWLSSGEIIRIRALRATNLDGQFLSLELPSARMVTMNPDALLALTASRATLVPLSTLAPELDRSLNDQWRPNDEAGTALRAINPGASLPQGADPAAPQGAAPRPTPFGAICAQDLELSGPKFVRWKLPPGARLVVGGVSLPQKAWEFGDCGVGIWQARRPIFQATLNKDTPDAVYALPLTESDLTITLAPGAAGPAQAYALLREPLIVIAKP